MRKADPPQRRDANRGGIGACEYEKWGEGKGEEGRVREKEVGKGISPTSRRVRVRDNHIDKRRRAVVGRGGRRRRRRREIKRGVNS